MRILKFIKNKVRSFIMEDESIHEFIEDPPEDNENDGENLCNIGLILDSNKELRFHIDWDHERQNIDFAMEIADIIRTLTSGGYNPSIFSILKDSCNNDENIDKEFVDMLIMYAYKPDQDLLDYKNLPVINPLRTFGESNFGNQGNVV